MNLLDMPSSSVGGRLLRLPLRLIPTGARLPILRGPARGRRWIVGAGNHGCWLGTYEMGQRKVLEKHVGPGDVFFDIGAHAGFYSLTGSALVGSEGHVASFEPLPENLHFLREHLSLNGIDNVTVIDKAVSNHTGSARFQRHRNRAMGGLSLGGDLAVVTTSLDTFVEGTKLPLPNCIKIDVEGAEHDVLTGARELLSRTHPVILLSTHGAAVHLACCRLLEELGFDLIPLTGEELERSDTILALDGT